MIISDGLQQSVCSSRQIPALVMPSAADEEQPITQIGDLIIRAESSSSRTLLPSRVASLISFATKSGSLGLQAGTAIGGIALNIARVSTLTGLELTRSAAEAILLRAAQDVTDAATG